MRVHVCSKIVNLSNQNTKSKKQAYKQENVNRYHGAPAATVNNALSITWPDVATHNMTDRFIALNFKLHVHHVIILNQ